MKTYIATFFSHFGAMKFHKACGKAGLNSMLMPVPRYLSSSCGTCCSYEVPETHASFPPTRKEQLEEFWDYDLEGIYEAKEK